MSKKSYPIILFLIAIILSGCEGEPFPRCIEPDDFGNPNITVPAYAPKGSSAYKDNRGNSSEGSNPNHIIRWKDTGLLTTGEDIILRADGRWTSWYRTKQDSEGDFKSYKDKKGYKDTPGIAKPTEDIKNAAYTTGSGVSWYDMSSLTPVPRNRICGPYLQKKPNISGCDSKSKCDYIELNRPPDNESTGTYGPPCWFINGYGAYILFKRPEDPDPNSTLNLMRYPRSPVVHIGYKSAEEDVENKGGVFSTAEHPVRDASCKLIKIKPGWKIYVHILDRYYYDNAGGYVINFLKGAYEPFNKPILETIRKNVQDLLFTQTEKLFKKIAQNNDYIGLVKALLLIFIVLIGIAYMLGMLQQPFQDIIIRILKIALIIQLISPNSWDFFYNHLLALFTRGIDEMIGLISSHGKYFDSSKPFASLDYMIIHKIFSPTVWNIKLRALMLVDFWAVFWVLILILVIFIYIFVIAYSFVVYLTGIISISVIVITMPILFLGLLFSRLKHTFEAWFTQALGYAFQSIFMFMLISLFSSLILNNYYRNLGFTVCYNEWLQTQFCITSGTCFAKKVYSTWTPGQVFDKYKFGVFYNNDLGQSRQRFQFTRGMGNILVPPDKKDYDYRYIDYPFFDPDVRTTGNPKLASLLKSIDPRYRDIARTLFSASNGETGYLTARKIASALKELEKFKGKWPTSFGKGPELIEKLLKIAQRYVAHTIQNKGASRIEAGKTFNRYAKTALDIFRSMNETMQDKDKIFNIAGQIMEEAEGNKAIRIAVNDVSKEQQDIYKKQFSNGNFDALYDNDTYSTLLAAALPSFSSVRQYMQTLHKQARGILDDSVSNLRDFTLAPTLRKKLLEGQALFNSNISSSSIQNDQKLNDVLGTISNLIKIKLRTKPRDAKLEVLRKNIQNLMGKISYMVSMKQKFAAAYNSILKSSYNGNKYISPDFADKLGSIVKRSVIPDNTPRDKNTKNRKVDPRGYDYEIIRDYIHKGHLDIWPEMFVMLLIALVLVHMRLFVQSVGAAIAGASPFASVVGMAYQGMFDPRSGGLGGKIGSFIQGLKSLPQDRFFGAIIEGITSVPRKIPHYLEKYSDTKVGIYAGRFIDKAQTYVGRFIDVAQRVTFSKDPIESHIEDMKTWKEVKYLKAMVGYHLNKITSPIEAMENYASFKGNRILGLENRGVFSYALDKYYEELRKIRYDILGADKLGKQESPVPSPEPFKPDTTLNKNPELEDFEIDEDGILNLTNSEDLEKAVHRHNSLASEIIERLDQEHDLMAEDLQDKYRAMQILEKAIRGQNSEIYEEKIQENAVKVEQLIEAELAELEEARVAAALAAAAIEEEEQRSTEARLALADQVKEQSRQSSTETRSRDARRKDRAQDQGIELTDITSRTPARETTQTQETSFMSSTPTNSQAESPESSLGRSPSTASTRPSSQNLDSLDTAPPARSRTRDIEEELFSGSTSEAMDTISTDNNIPATSTSTAQASRTTDTESLEGIETKTVQDLEREISKDIPPTTDTRTEDNTVPGYTAEGSDIKSGSTSEAMDTISTDNNIPATSTSTAQASRTTDTESLEGIETKTVQDLDRTISDTIPENISSTTDTRTEDNTVPGYTAEGSDIKSGSTSEAMDTISTDNNIPATSTSTAQASRTTDTESLEGIETKTVQDLDRTISDTIPENIPPTTDTRTEDNTVSGYTAEGSDIKELPDSLQTDNVKDKEIPQVSTESAGGISDTIPENIHDDNDTSSASTSTAQEDHRATGGSSDTIPENIPPTTDTRTEDNTVSGYTAEGSDIKELPDSLQTDNVKDKEIPQVSTESAGGISDTIPENIHDDNDTSSASTSTAQEDHRATGGSSDTIPENIPPTTDTRTEDNTVSGYTAEGSDIKELPDSLQTDNVKDKEIPQVSTESAGGISDTIPENIHDDNDTSSASTSTAQEDHRATGGSSDTIPENISSTTDTRTEDNTVSGYTAEGSDIKELPDSLQTDNVKDKEIPQVSTESAGGISDTIPENIHDDNDTSSASTSTAQEDHRATGGSSDTIPENIPPTTDTRTEDNTVSGYTAEGSDIKELPDSLQTDNVKDKEIPQVSTESAGGISDTIPENIHDDNDTSSASTSTAQEDHRATGGSSDTIPENIPPTTDTRAEDTRQSIETEEDTTPKNAAAALASKTNDEFDTSMQGVELELEQIPSQTKQDVGMNVDKSFATEKSIATTSTAKTTSETLTKKTDKVSTDDNAPAQSNTTNTKDVETEPGAKSKDFVELDTFKTSEPNAAKINIQPEQTHTNTASTKIPSASSVEDSSVSIKNKGPVDSSKDDTIQADTASAKASQRQIKQKSTQQTTARTDTSETVEQKGMFGRIIEKASMLLSGQKKESSTGSIEQILAGKETELKELQDKLASVTDENERAKTERKIAELKDEIDSLNEKLSQ